MPGNSERSNLALMERRPCANQHRARGGGFEQQPTETKGGREQGRAVCGGMESVRVCYIHTCSSRDEVLKGLRLAA